VLGCQEEANFEVRSQNIQDDANKSVKWPNDPAGWCTIVHQKRTGGPNQWLSRSYCDSIFTSFWIKNKAKTSKLSYKI